MNRFRQIARCFRTMSPFQILKRLGTLCWRYGIGKSRFTANLDGFIKTAERHGIGITFPITAAVLSRHPVLFRNAAERGVELAVHGLRHIDYSQAEDSYFESNYKTASTVFRDFGLKNLGHRFPYLRRNKKRLASLSSFGLQWDSSETVMWPVLNHMNLDGFHQDALRRIVESYNVQNSDECFSLPFQLNGIIEIPVSLPDDDILIERLGIKDPDELFEIWWNLIEQAKTKQELAVLQLHPERFSIFQKPLELILHRLKTDKSAWIAPLGEIAAWWKKGRNWNWSIEPIGSGKYQINAMCSKEAEIRIREHESTTSKGLIYSGKAKPIVGIEAGGDPGWRDFTEREGFAADCKNDGNGCQYWIPRGMSCTHENKRSFLDKIRNENLPLLRIRRWPKGKEFGVAITGDIDGVDLLDILDRIHG